ncbi:hypothetical protein BBJ29_001389 [Phytophthora kernoviae]|uniref:Protein BIG1 n=1 Tax=Phytophthora kernoviae TaxID=325452 RepID=A0A3F2S023_9STRA|nr:hypothetical protein BBJ29_001389 [Phytophthora kernoviae]RLN67143.1 hypothetical protein BBP00_00001781 [Phytophthora kernoviae]
MKTLLSTALCGLAATASTASATTLFPHVPLVMWSQHPIFSGSNAYLSSEMDEAAVASVVERVLVPGVNSDKEGVLNSQEGASQQSEVMCLFLLPSLASEDVSQLASGSGASSFVQSAVQSSVSSVVIPHTTRANPLLPKLATVKPHIVGYQDLDVFVASAEGQAVLSNGKTDLVVVQLPATLSLPEVDAAIQSATSILTAASHGKTAFALTGNDAEAMQIKEPIVRRLASEAKSEKSAAAIVCEAGYLVGHSAAGTAFCFSHYVNITPDIMAGLLFALFFVFLAYVGLSVLHQIQTPTRYPSHGAPRGKEF